ncbi:FecR family protein [Mucilaginibacter sp. ZT4R22]|uniref:FecR family protein n=1 Tax=Mucilaginibacter pankratovii TaxID=2772110 RepID=A0ABR7WWG0_9SPHI|nr:FecR family protein [Mucilaginibacter pankratovii]MBD1366615.1 FecR family protein [Mucilaginibacter pankratovii]
MKTSRLRLQYLFDKYYNQTATPQERDELFAIIDAGKCDEELSRYIRQAWDELKPGEPLFDPERSSAILKNILGSADADTSKKPGKPLILWGKIAAAAVMLLFVGFCAHKYLRQKKTVQTQAVVVKRPAHDALPGGNKAILTLANGKTIVLDNAQNGTLAKQGATIVKKTADGQLLYNAAAIADNNPTPSINTIVTPRGGQYQIILPDGTKVWLNAASSLRFPTFFTGKTREVNITGEAYFEVAKNPAMPFKVKTNRAEIEVLGTHFNIMAYDDEATMKTTLLEGAVNIKSGSFNARLKPGQQAQITANGQSKVVDDVDVDDETAWKNGIFQFRDAGIDMILRQASRWYDVDVVYKGKIPHREFNGRIARNVKASELLNMLEYTGVKLKIEGKNIIVL